MLQFAEGEVTKLRREFKLVLGRDEALALCARLSASLGGYLSPPTSIDACVRKSKPPLIFASSSPWHARHFVFRSG